MKKKMGSKPTIAGDIRKIRTYVLRSPAVTGVKSTDVVADYGELMKAFDAIETKAREMKQEIEKKDMAVRMLVEVVSSNAVSQLPNEIKAILDEYLK